MVTLHPSSSLLLSDQLFYIFLSFYLFIKECFQLLFFCFPSKWTVLRGISQKSAAHLNEWSLVVILESFLDICEMLIFI